MILLVTSVFPPEPVVSAMIGHDLATALSGRWKVQVISPRPTRPMGFPLHHAFVGNGKFDHTYLNSYTCPKSKLLGRMRESYSFGKLAASYIAKHHGEIECLIVHSWPLVGQYLIMKAAFKYGIPSVLHIVDIYPEALMGRLPILKGFIYKALLPMDQYAQQHATRVVTLSGKMEDHLTKTRNLVGGKVTTIPNWHDESRFLEAGGSMEKESHDQLFTFMFLGNLSPTASLQNLLSAFASCGVPDSRLVIAGDGHMKRQLKAQAASYTGIRIDFWDAPMEKVPLIQEQANILLLTLRKGGARFALPSKLPAYMFSGKPIIASVEEESDTADVVTNARCGWIVAAEDTEALSRQMKEAYETPPERLREFGRNGFIFAMDHFSKRANLQKFKGIIEELAG